MASSHKKRTGLRAALIVLLCLVLVCVVAAAVLYSLVSRRVKAFQSGASFALDYTITSTEAEPPALYALLDKFGGTTGSLTGQYTPRAVQLALYPTGTSTVNDAPLTRMYISEEETLYDAGQLYNKLRSTVVAEYPLASLLLPGWSLGSYISQDQLADPAGGRPRRHRLAAGERLPAGLETAQNRAARQRQEGLPLPSAAESRRRGGRAAADSGHRKAGSAQDPVPQGAHPAGRARPPHPCRTFRHGDCRPDRGDRPYFPDAGL